MEQKMVELILEKRKIDKISQRKRLLCYYYFYLQMQKKNASEMWDDYDKLLAGIEDWVKYYEKFFANPSINDEEECVEMCYLITGKEDVLLQNEQKNVWRKIKDVIKREIDCEKKLQDILNQKAEEHPIISKIIIVILTGILVGLVEDCIHDAIQMNNGQNESQITNIYIIDENNNYTQMLYNEDRIVIKEINQMEE